MKLLSHNSKTDLSWNLPAGPGFCLGYDPTGVCGYCYARKGRFLTPAVHKANLARWRLQATRPALLETALITALHNTNKHHGYFRVFGSGDFRNQQDILMWLRIARACPTIHFWFATAAWTKRSLWTDLYALHMTLPNTTVRQSHHTLNATKPLGTMIAALPVAYVTTLTGNCPASTRHSSCRLENCRQCWTKNFTPFYPKH